MTVSQLGQLAVLMRPPGPLGHMGAVHNIFRMPRAFCRDFDTGKITTLNASIALTAFAFCTAYCNNANH